MNTQTSRAFAHVRIAQDEGGQYFPTRATMRGLAPVRGSTPAEFQANLRQHILSNAPHIKRLYLTWPDGSQNTFLID